jgi:hypothetical protein
LNGSNIKEESLLLKEIRDIHDELTMMEKIFSIQMETMVDHSQPRECMLKIKAMKARAKATNESVGTVSKFSGRGG